ncbi:MAG: selenocysteine-specific translation elongation factor [Solirubrobacteraceae bacterium]
MSEVCGVGGGCGVSGARGPLTVGTAGHVDHGKTSMVAALTGVDTDRLPEEKARGLSIELGYAPLQLPSGRRLSMIDVPGHERFIRTMVAGASGIDFYVMVIAAPDGVCAQTVEHAQVLRALGIDRGIVVITKTDLAGGGPAAAQASELLPGASVVVCPPEFSSRRAAVLVALADATDGLAGRAEVAGPALMHVDRVLTINGVGTVVTGTLVSGQIVREDRLLLYPRGLEVRVRGLQVHGLDVERALAGQRVAVNLARTPRDQVARGDVLAAAGAVQPSRDFMASIESVQPAGGSLPGVVHVHHGTRATPARLRLLDLPGTARLRCEQPLMIRAAGGDRLVLRDPAGRRTLGGAAVLEPQSPAAATANQSSRQAAATGHSERDKHTSDAYAAPSAPAAGDSERDKHTSDAYAAPRPPFEPAAVAEAEAAIRELIARDGSVTLPGLRDHLGVSRSEAKAMLDHFDRCRLTLRRADDTRVLRRRPQAHR